jgi:hypothetical protein
MIRDEFQYVGRKPKIQAVTFVPKKGKLKRWHVILAIIGFALFFGLFRAYGQIENAQSWTDQQIPPDCQVPSQPGSLSY